MLGGDFHFSETSYTDHIHAENLQGACVFSSTYALRDNDILNSLRRVGM